MRSAAAEEWRGDRRTSLAGSMVKWLVAGLRARARWWRCAVFGESGDSTAVVASLSRIGLSAAGVVLPWLEAGVLLLSCGPTSMYLLGCSVPISTEHVVLYTAVMFSKVGLAQCMAPVAADSSSLLLSSGNNDARAPAEARSAE